MQLKIVVIQPTSLCNLNCRYCYVPGRRDRRIMNDEILETIFERTLSSNLVRDRVQFLWHAGEPLLAGKDFYRRAVDFATKHNSRGLKVDFTIQTNATLIDDEWCELFNEHKFHIGVSIDGPAFLHDRQRQNWAGGSSHAKAMAGYEVLRRHSIRSGALCVLTRESLEYPYEILEFFVKHGFSSIGFNPEETENDNQQSSLDADYEHIVQLYRNFVQTVFKLQRTTYPQLRIREISRVFRVLAEKRKNPHYYRIPPEIPPLSMITINRDGEISPYCPEFAGATSTTYNNFIIGNIALDTIDALPKSQWFVKLRQDVEKSIEMCASSCRYFDLCGSAPLSNKFSENGTLLSTQTKSCRLDYQVLSDVLIQEALKV